MKLQKKSSELIEDFLVTPKRASMNYVAKLEELVPFIMAWNSDVSRFLERPRAVQRVAVTY